MPTSPPAVPEELRGSEVILVVDDEPAVRSLVCGTLRRFGYFVLEAKHGEDALTVLQEYHAPAHLVVTDLVMPEMGGAQLIGMLHEWYPDLKVLYVSGYSRELVESKGGLFPGMRYLPKPFTPAVLAKTIREVLDG